MDQAQWNSEKFLQKTLHNSRKITVQTKEADNTSLKENKFPEGNRRPEIQ